MTTSSAPAGRGAFAIYRDTVDAEAWRSEELPTAQRRAVQQRSRQAAAAAMERAVAECRPVADGIAGRLH